MNNDLPSKLNSLSEKDKSYFYKRLSNVLNDRYSCFVYGGINNREYCSMPKDKVEKVKYNLYQEMFNNIIPPSKMIVELSQFLRQRN